MVTITLKPALEQAVTEQAKQQGTTPELLALDKLNEPFLPLLPSAPPQADNLADYLGEFIGCLDSGNLVRGSADVGEDRREVRRGNAAKAQDGRLRCQVYRF